MKCSLFLPLAASAAMLSSPFAAAAPSAIDTTAAGAREPPLCTEKAALKAIKQGYEFLESQGGNLKVKEITGVKELKLGTPPPGVNQYANKTTYAVSSRSCEATLLLSDGKTDSVYWRMDYLVEGNGHSINYDSCSLRHDMIDTKCQRHRSGG
ncbi:MAG: exported protein of unknown function [Gammaproteobacteria bacterium]|nr:exported protein of unknown function [Gammaproteobacteria bacterium]